MAHNSFYIAVLRGEDDDLEFHASYPTLDKAITAARDLREQDEPGWLLDIEVFEKQPDSCIPRRCFSC